MPEEPPSSHISRRMILNYLREHPGANRKELSAVLQIGESTLRYHLSRLERTGYLDVMKNDGHPRYYRRILNGESRDDTDDLTRDQKRLVKVIKDNPYMTRTEIISQVPTGNESVKEDLNKLVKKRLIAKVGDGADASFCVLTPEELKIRILKVLISKLVKREIDEKTFLKLKAEAEGRFP